MKIASRIVAYLFHPLLLPTYLFAIFMWIFPPAMFPFPARSFKAILILIFFTTFVLPAVNVFFFKAFGAISSMTMPLRRERIFPFLMIATLYCIVTYLLYTKQGVSYNDNFLKFLLLIDLLVITSFLLTLFTKASVHSLAISAGATILFLLNNLVENGVFFYPMLASVLLAGIVMTSRLYLQEHTPNEVALGSIAGIVVGGAGMVLLF